MPRQVYAISIFTLIFCVFSAGATETLSINDERFPAPLQFNVELPDSYQKEPAKRYWLLFDFHPYSNSYLSGMYDWLSHNGEWPWPETIIVTPKKGNPVGTLFDSSGETTPLISFFAESLLPAIDERYRTSGYRIMSGFRVNGTLVLSTLLRKPTLFNAYFATSPELHENYAGILSTLEAGGLPEALAGRYVLLTHGDSVKETHQQDEYQQLHRFMQANNDVGLHYQYEDLSGRAFMSLPLLTLMQGIEALYNQQTEN